MIVSAGQLHSSISLLELVAGSPIPPAAVKQARDIVLVCPAMDLLNICTRCGWMEVDADGNLKPSKRGDHLRGMAQFQDRLREQLHDVIASLQPAWSKKIMHGRRELVRFVHPDVSQCFKEAGLLDTEPTEDIVRWWDELANLARGVRSAALTEIGRCGERLSLDYERKRTGREPMWLSIETSFSGFDILTVVSEVNSVPMQVEVKASELRLTEAFLHLSKNEWEAAQAARAHAFHVWHLCQRPELAVITIDLMSPHIPTNNGDGKWETVRIPFAAFAALFRASRTTQPS